MAEPAPVIRIERAHKLYREGMHDEALALYSGALSVARSKAQRIALHSNRAACYLKLRHFKKAAEECSSVLELDQEHTGALMLRVQILVTLKDYQSALFDVNRLTEIDPSSDVYANLHARLKTQLSLAPIPEADEEAFTHDREREEKEDAEEKEETEERKKENELLRNPSKKPSQMSPESKVTGRTRNPESQSTQIQKAERISESKNASNSAAEQSKTLEKAAKLKGRYGLDYSRWDNIDADSSENDEDEDDDKEPRYRFRIRTL